MSKDILYFAESAATSSGWQHRLREFGFEVWRTTDPEQLASFARTRSAVGAIVEASLTAMSAEKLAETIRKLREDPSNEGMPIVAMFAGFEAMDHLPLLAEAGITGFYLKGMPETLLLHSLDAGRAVQQLRTLEQNGMTVGKLAAETRQRIHDLSQPLAALQGRLQILQSKTSKSDPHQERIGLMVQLVMEISTQLRELQELHRQYG